VQCAVESFIYVLLSNILCVFVFYQRLGKNNSELNNINLSVHNKQRVY